MNHLKEKKKCKLHKYFSEVRGGLEEGSRKRVGKEGHKVVVRHLENRGDTVHEEVGRATARLSPESESERASTGLCAPWVNLGDKGGTGFLLSPWHEPRCGCTFLRRRKRNRLS